MTRPFNQPSSQLPGRAWRAISSLAYRTPLYGLTLAGRAPSRINDAPPEFWPGDPIVAAGVLGGTFTVAGHRLALGDNPWARPMEGRQAAADLHGFGWLRDLWALGSEVTAVRARELTTDWIETCDKWESVAWRADVLGERLANWFVHYGFLTASADDGFRQRLLRSAARQARHLGRVAATAAPDARLFLAIKGLIYAGVCLPGNDGDLQMGHRLLAQEMERQVLPDGGHFQRSPETQLEVLRHLVDMRRALAAAKAEVPVALQATIDRMAPMLRGFRHGDGRLALFNGGTEGDERLVDQVLAQSETRAKPMDNAPHTGFYRVARGHTFLLADVGGPPPSGADRRAHAGALAFEMSLGRERLIVNCGAWNTDDGDWQAALRSTAAHSTLSVDDTNSARVLPDGGLGRGTVGVTCTRREADNAVWIDALHDGYQKLFSLMHGRTLFLSADGNELRGRDTLRGAGGRTFTIRFHLHPRVQASVVRGAEAVLLKLPSGKGWQFMAQGGRIGLTESVYLGTGERKRSQQIVVSGDLGGRGAAVKWRLNRLGVRQSPAQ